MAMSPTPGRLALTLSLSLFLTSVGRPVRAEPTTSSLSWIRLPGAESCISTQELGARVEKHLGRAALVSPSVADLSLEGRIERTGAQKYRAVVGGTRRGGATIGTRELLSPGPECHALDDGLVLVVALMIDPTALSPVPTEPAPPAPPTQITHEVVHERVVHEIEVVHAPSPPWLVEASIAGVAAIARVPGIAPGVALALRTGPSRLAAFQLSASVVPSSELDVGSRHVTFAILEGGIAYCPGVAVNPRVAVGGCVGLRVGAVQVRGHGFDSDLDVDRGLADVGMGGHVEVTLAGPVFANASASALIHLVRLDTTMTSVAGKTVILDERSALGGELSLGVGVRFSP